MTFRVGSSSRCDRTHSVWTNLPFPFRRKGPLHYEIYSIAVGASPARTCRRRFEREWTPMDGSAHVSFLFFWGKEMCWRHLRLSFFFFFLSDRGVLLIGDDERGPFLCGAAYFMVPGMGDSGRSSPSMAPNVCVVPFRRTMRPRGRARGVGAAVSTDPSCNTDRGVRRARERRGVTNRGA